MMTARTNKFPQDLNLLVSNVYLPIIPVYMTSPVTYDDFINQNGALVNDGGPWSLHKSSGDINCASSQAAWCTDVPNCISCWVDPSASEPYYGTLFIANVSVPMNQYGNPDSLSYDFSYSLNWASNKTPWGYALKPNMFVGDSSFSDTLMADDYEELMHTRQTWGGSTFSHRGSTPVITYNDKSTGYIQIVVALSFPRLSQSSTNYFMKGVTFRIVNSTSTASSLLQSSSRSSASPFSTPLSSIPSDSGLETSSPAASSNGSSAPKRLSPATIAGIVLGPIAIVILLTLFCFHRRNTRWKRDGKVASQYGTDSRTDQESVWKSPFPVSVVTSPSNSDPQNQHDADPFRDPPRPPQPITQQPRNTPRHQYSSSDGAHTSASTADDRARSATVVTPPPAYTPTNLDELQLSFPPKQPRLRCNSPCLSPTIDSHSPTTPPPFSVASSPNDGRPLADVDDPFLSTQV
ncbi:hypothetical protein FRC14_007552 [Serendipita sp. 396]|nr:hypothetical protein FRC14_007552 [Serendipita sp. 396]KAG8785006.1 hypothetical protein FRC15_002168 [Serendipita sp. 397]KAG8820038.1 hypothetical protein FRC19_009295 [Serendipita sp. 401]KAG8823143.1 hypothetical protein FRC18_010812 [Serendipita sp. 400]KAG8869686.1 hypothetical protein FRC20_001073 [Serendipita sp. 405]